MITIKKIITNEKNIPKSIFVLMGNLYYKSLLSIINHFQAFFLDRHLKNIQKNSFEY